MISLRSIVKAASLIALFVGISTIANADNISGSLSFVFVNATSNGTDLSNATLLVATNTLTEEPGGTGDFAPIPVLTSFGPISLNEATISTGGGFMVSNFVWGSFVASSASLVTRTPTFLNIDMSGTFTPGPGFGDDFTPTPATAHVTFDQTGPAISGAFTIETPHEAPTPEIASLLMLSTGAVLIFGGHKLRSMLGV